MAGSLNSIVADDGTFTMKLIENLGDAHEALEECYRLIKSAVIKSRPRKRGYPRWVAVRDMLGVGSTEANELCLMFKLDPNEIIK